MPHAAGMTHHTPAPTILDERDAARYLGYRPITLRAWRREGRGPAYHRAGRSIRYHLDDLDAWLRARRVETRDSRTLVHDDAHQQMVGA